MQIKHPNLKVYRFYVFSLTDQSGLPSVESTRVSIRKTLRNFCERKQNFLLSLRYIYAKEYHFAQ